MRVTSGDLLRRGPAGGRRRAVVLPTTRLGTWAVGLAAANVVLVPAWRLLGPLGAFPGLACGVVALLAVVRHGERALAVYAALLPFVFVVTFVLAELLIGHD